MMGDESKGVEGNGSIGSMRVGNTKRPSPSKHWCFTGYPLGINEVGSDGSIGSDILEWCELVREELGFICEKYVVQLERGEEGKLHLQGYVALKKKGRPLKMFKRLPTAHWEKARSPKHSIEYCQKTDTRVLGPWTKGLPKPVVKIGYERLRDEQKEIADKYVEDEDPLFGREIHWYWESTGGWGKSILCKYLVDNMGAMVVQGASKDVLCGISRWIERHGEAPRMIVFDVPRCNEGHVSYQALESVKNGCFFSGKYESGMLRFNSPHVLVFANTAPDQSKLSEDRWVVTSLRNEYEGNEYDSF